MEDLSDFLNKRSKEINKNPKIRKMSELCNEIVSPFLSPVLTMLESIDDKETKKLILEQIIFITVMIGSDNDIDDAINLIEKVKNVIIKMDNEYINHLKGKNE